MSKLAPVLICLVLVLSGCSALKKGQSEDGKQKAALIKQAKQALTEYSDAVAANDFKTACSLVSQSVLDKAKLKDEAACVAAQGAGLPPAFEKFTRGPFPAYANGVTGVVTEREGTNKWSVAMMIETEQMTFASATKQVE